MRNSKTLICLFVWMTMVYGGDVQARIMMRTLVNGQPAMLMLDTKTDTTVLFAHAAERIGLKWEKPHQAPAPGRVAAGKSQPCQFDAGGGAHTAVLAVVEEPRFKQTNIDGVLSWSSMNANILFMDGERHQFSAIGAIPEWAKQWQSFPIKKESSSLIFQTKAGDVLIDTAAAAGVRLGTKAWAQWIALHKDAPYTIDAYSTSITPIVLTRVFRADPFKTGALEIDNVLVEQDGGQVDPDFDIALGLNALARLMIIVDGPNSVCYVNKAKPEPDNLIYNRLGAVFVPENIQTSDTLVAVVASDTPAAKAGIQNRDELVKINDTDVTGWRTTPGIMPLGRFWAQPAGTKIVLGLIREGKPFTIPVTLADILGL